VHPPPFFFPPSLPKTNSFFPFPFCTSVRLVLQNFFECMYNQHGDDDDATSGQKSQALPAAVDAADARAMEKFAHVAEKFVQKSITAALAPYKDAIMRFSQVQMDTVRRLQVLCLLDCCSL